MIELRPELVPGLQDIEGFSHLSVHWYEPARVEHPAKSAPSWKRLCDRGAACSIILLLADRYSYTAICDRIDCTAQAITTWKARYQRTGSADCADVIAARRCAHAAGRGADPMDMVISRYYHADDHRQAR